MLSSGLSCDVNILVPNAKLFSLGNNNVDGTGNGHCRDPALKAKLLSLS